jgi:hypothetical protein
MRTPAAALGSAAAAAAIAVLSESRGSFELRSESGGQPAELMFE